MAQISCKTLFKVYLYIFKQRVTRKKKNFTRIFLSKTRLNQFYVSLNSPKHTLVYQISKFKVFYL